MAYMSMGTPFCVGGFWSVSASEIVAFRVRFLEAQGHSLHTVGVQVFLREFETS